MSIDRAIDRVVVQFSADATRYNKVVDQVVAKAYNFGKEMGKAVKADAIEKLGASFKLASIGITTAVDRIGRSVRIMSSIIRDNLTRVWGGAKSAAADWAEATKAVFSAIGISARAMGRGIQQVTAGPVAGLVGGLMMARDAARAAFGLLGAGGRAVAGRVGGAATATWARAGAAGRYVGSVGRELGAGFADFGRASGGVLARGALYAGGLPLAMIGQRLTGPLGAAGRGVGSAASGAYGGVRFAGDYLAALGSNLAGRFGPALYMGSMNWISRLRNAFNTAALFGPGVGRGLMSGASFIGLGLGAAGRGIGSIIPPVSSALGAAGGFLGRGVGAVGGAAASGIGQVGGVGLSAIGSLAGTARLGLLGLGAAAAYAGYEAISLASEYEQASVALKVMTGSAETAKTLLDQLSKLAIETPFKSNELIKEAQSLSAYGVETEQIIPTLKRLGDVAAGGFGGSIDDRLARIVKAFGQVRQVGRLMAQEKNQFINAGVPIVEYLAKVKGVGQQEIPGMIQRGSISFNDVVAAINAMTNAGGRFFELMDERSQTVAGRWSALVETLEVGARNAGLAFFKGFGLTEILDQFRAMTDTTGVGMSKLEGFFGRLRELFDVVVAGVKAAGGVIFKDFTEAFDAMASGDWEGFKSNFQGLVDAVLVGIGQMIEAVKSFARFVATDILIPVGEAMEVAGIGQKAKGAYGFAREKGASMAVAAGSSAVTGFEDLVLGAGDAIWDAAPNLGLGSQMFDGRHQERFRHGLRNQGVGVDPGNPLKSTAEAILRGAQPGNLPDDLRNALGKGRAVSYKDDPNWVAAEAARERGYYLPGELVVPKVSSKGAVPEIAKVPGISPQAQKLAEQVKRSFEPGEKGFDKFANRFSRLQEAFKGPLVPLTDKDKAWLGDRHDLAPGAEFDPASGTYMKRGRPPLSREEYRFGLVNSYQEMAQTVRGVQEKFPEAMMAGSSEAQDTINRSNQQQMSVAEQVAKDVAIATKVLEQSRDYNEKVADALEKLVKSGVILLPKGVK